MDLIKKVCCQAIVNPVLTLYKCNKYVFRTVCTTYTLKDSVSQLPKVRCKRKGAVLWENVQKHVSHRY